jgi:hypothetical protein
VNEFNDVWSGKTGVVFSFDHFSVALALRELAFGLEVLVEILAVLFKLVLDSLVGVGEVVLHLVLQFLDDLVELIHASWRNEFGVVEVLLDEEVMGELGSNWLFILFLVVLPALGLAWHLFLLVLLGLLWLDDLHTLFLGPCALLQLFLDVDCLLAALGLRFLGGWWIKTLAVIYEEDAVVYLLLIAVGSLALLLLLWLSLLFGLNSFLLVSSFLLFTQFLALSLCLFGLPFLTLLLLHLGRPSNPSYLFLLILVFLSLFGKVLIYLHDFLPQIIDLLFESLALLFQPVGVFIVFLLVSNLLHFGKELGDVLENAMDLPNYLILLGK